LEGKSDLAISRRQTRKASPLIVQNIPKAMKEERKCNPSSHFYAKDSKIAGIAAFGPRISARPRPIATTPPSSHIGA
jgi:hypothetical protein